MDCSVVKDLIPLYIDDCCSEESASIVKEHIDSCPQCKAFYENMSVPFEINQTISAPVSLSRINDWKASVLQSILLFVSFTIITIGVGLEASTPTGFTNGYWAASIVIPATGFLLSLANWYFIRLYKNRKSFSNYSLLTTLGITVCAYIWAGFHYELSILYFAKLLHGISFKDLFEMAIPLTHLFGIGILLTAIFCTLSKVLSNKYAKMLGKE